MVDEDISRRLQEQGLSPRAITEAFNQERIKKAVSSEQDELETPTPNIPRNPSQLYIPRTQEAENTPNEFYAPKRESEIPKSFSQEEYYPQQESGNNYEESPGYTADTIIEIAEQVF